MDRHGKRSSHVVRALIGIIAIICVSQPVRGAQDAATLKAPQEEAKKGALKGSFLLQTAGTVNTANERSSSGLYLLSGSYKMPMDNGSISFGASIGYQRQYTYEGSGTQTLYADKMPEGRMGDWVDPRFSVVRSHEKIWGQDAVSYGIKGTIAGLSFASERKTQAGAIGPGISITNTWGRTTVINSLDYRYVHHHYKTRNDGTVNSPHVAIQNNNFDYSLGSRSGITTSLGFTQAISYQGTAKGALGVGLESYYNLSDKMSAALGISNDTTGYAADGQTRELDLLNPDSATFYFNLDFKI